jgi:hypothetical protein
MSSEHRPLFDPPKLDSDVAAKSLKHNGCDMAHVHVMGLSHQYSFTWPPDEPRRFSAAGSQRHA